LLGSSLPISSTRNLPFGPELKAEGEGYATCPNKPLNFLAANLLL